MYQKEKAKLKIVAEITTNCYCFCVSLLCVVSNVTAELNVECVYIMFGKMSPQFGKK